MTNSSTASHTWSASGGRFTGSGNLVPTASYTYTFRYTGSFGFYCAYHSYMTGTITVS